MLLPISLGMVVRPFLNNLNSIIQSPKVRLWRKTAKNAEGLHLRLSVSMFRSRLSLRSRTVVQTDLFKVIATKSRFPGFKSWGVLSSSHSAPAFDQISKGAV